MPLTPAQRERIIAAIERKIPQAVPCPACRHESWTLADGIIMMTLQEAKAGPTMSGPTLPSVALVCTTCGNTLFFNVILLGLAAELLPDDHDESGRD